jgi:hypothetical protein
MPHGEGTLLPIDRWFNRVPLLGRVAICVALVLLVGALDWLTGAEVSLLVFYAVPVALAAWTLGRAGGFTIAVASAATSILTTNVLGRTYHFEAAPYWEAVMVRLAFLLLVAELLTRLRIHWLRERSEMAKRLVAADARVETETALRRSTVEQLRHADRLTTVGQLAAGLAQVDQIGVGEGRLAKLRLGVRKEKLARQRRIINIMLHQRGGGIEAEKIDAFFLA